MFYAVDIICGIAGVLDNFLDNSGEARADFDDMHDDIPRRGMAYPPHRGTLARSTPPTPRAFLGLPIYITRTESSTPFSAPVFAHTSLFGANRLWKMGKVDS